MNILGDAQALLFQHPLLVQLQHSAPVALLPVPVVAFQFVAHPGGLLTGSGHQPEAKHHVPGSRGQAHCFPSAPSDGLVVHRNGANFEPVGWGTHQQISRRQDGANPERQAHQSGYWLAFAH
jgi:hypothetical protein